MALGPSANALNLLRLLFATAVIVSDAWWIGGYGPQPAFLGIKLGTAGILGFFAISGYLTTVTAHRASSFREFAAARVFPFYAGLVVAAIAVAFFAAPLGALLTGGHYEIRSGLAFLGMAVLVLSGLATTPSIGTSLKGNVDYLDWNGILWTLTWAALCYVIVAAVVFLLRRRSAERHARTVIALLLAATTAADSSQIFAKGFEPDRTAFVLPLIAFFLAGSLLAFYREQVHVELLPAILAAALALAFLIMGLGPVLTALPLTYLILSAASLRSVARIQLSRDVAYGIYLYGWPVQQLLAALHVPALLPPLGYAAVALIAVLPFAFASSVVVEQLDHRWLQSQPSRQNAHMELVSAH